MRRGFKLSSLEPDTVARDTARGVLGTVLNAASGLAPVVTVDGGINADLSETKVYKLVRALVVYAQGGRRPAQAGVAGEVLARWCGADDVRTNTKTKTPLQLVLTAVEAREAYEAKLALTSQQLGALCDLDRDHVNGMASRGEIPTAYRSEESAHLPWRFDPTKATFRRWLAERIQADAETLSRIEADS